MWTVEQLRDKVFGTLQKPHGQGEEKSELPLSLLQRVPKEPGDMTPQVIFATKSQLLIPLSTNFPLRNKYKSHANILRMGRLLEDIDLMAALTVVEHAKQLIDPQTGHFPITIVTALVDRIVLRGALPSTDRDIRLTGHVSWVGRSSVEVTMSVEQQTPSSQTAQSQVEESWDHVLLARIVMVARHPVTHRAVPFVPLCASTHDEAGQQALRAGEQRSLRRQRAAEQSLLKTRPNPDETYLVHDLFLQTVDSQKMSFHQRVKPANAVWISETGVKTALLCHLEESNVYNKIFGGYLMRQALELAWIAVRRFASGYPVLFAIDDLVFKHPVDVGSMLFLSSYIVYRPPDTRRFVVRVNVEVLTIDPDTHEEKRLVTNTAYFVYGVEDSETRQLRDVYPETYGESMMYLDGKRHYEAVISEAGGGNATAAVGSSPSATS